MRGARRLVAGGLGLVWGLSCGEPNQPSGPTVVQVNLFVDVSTLFIGESGRFRAIPFDSSGNQLPQALVRWTSSNSHVLAVDDTGAYAAVGRGVAIATVTAGMISKSATIAVLPRVARITVTPSGDTLLRGTTLQLTAVARAPDSSVVPDVPFIWRSSSPDVATVDSTGLIRVTAVGPFAIGANIDQRVSGSAVFAVTQLFDSLSSGFLSCGLESLGTAYCWDSPRFPLVGAGSDDVSGGRTWPVAGGVHFITISSGVLTGCGVALSQDLYCWPVSFTYTSYQFVPGTAALLSGPTGFTGVSVGEYHSCAVGIDTQAYCWGESNAFGELGDGRQPQPSAAPSLVQGGIHFRTVTVGEWHSCGLSTSGVVYCWGLNDVAQLGIDSSATCPDAHPCSPLPTAVSGRLTFMAVTAAARHTCALTTDGIAYCWGNNTAGQLGAPTTETCGDQYNAFPCSTKPVEVAGGHLFTAIGVGAGHTCGLTMSGAVYCWGDNTHGQIGTETSDTCVNQQFQNFACSRTPLAVHAELTASQFSVGADRTCVVAKRRPYCW